MSSQPSTPTSEPGGPSAALLKVGDLPKGFSSAGKGSTPFSLCDLKIGKRVPRGFEHVGSRTFSHGSFGQIEQTVATAQGATAARYVRKVRRAAGSCSRFTEGRGAGRRAFVVAVSPPGDLGRDSLSVTVREIGDLPLGISAVFATAGNTLVRIVDLGSGSPLELALTRSLVARALSRL